MILNKENTVILIIDIQEKLLNAVFNKEIVEKKSEILSKAAQKLNLPVIITEQYPQGLGGTVTPIKEAANSDTKYFEKVSFNALENDEIVSVLNKLNRKQIIVLGIETHICVHQTVETLINLGYEVTVAKDACGSRSETEHLTAINIMQFNGANIKTTEMILFELLKTAKHPNFKEIQSLIK